MTARTRLAKLLVPAALACAVAACGDNSPAPVDFGPIADGIMAPLGQPIPSATPEQMATFRRGLEVFNRRFSRADGLGPAFNVTFCGACHERPVPGGSSALYRNFFIAGTKQDNEPFRFLNGVSLFDCGDLATPPDQRETNPPPESETGAVAGVIRQFYYGDERDARPDPRLDPTQPLDVNIIAQRNAIPFFGVGLIAELSSDEILKRADENDRDGDGISGRPNMIGDFVGRFGLKAQTTSIEGFIRGPLYNHLGITSDPLTDEQRSRLPVDSSDAALGVPGNLASLIMRHAQAAAPGTPNCDFDSAPDPELSPDDLFDLISFSMLLAAPQMEQLTEQGKRGQDQFAALGCAKCHTPRLNGPRGPIPVFSDLLLHDMGPDLADNLVFGQATGSEFRTQPLWGLSAEGPYLHDGRAATIDEAIRDHGGEAERARGRYENLDQDQRDDLMEFLMSLGGRSQMSVGLVPPDAPIPAVGELGGPRRELSASEQEDFLAGRAAFDQDHDHSTGLGGPRHNGSGCRACHFDPVIGGSGPRGVNVMRHGIVDGDGNFTVPDIGTTILHKSSAADGDACFPEDQVNVFEHRQTPPLFGAGLLDRVSESTIKANADPNDDDHDGISGRVNIVPDGRVGRFGWKADVPTLEEFTRDGFANEMGMTLPPKDGTFFGITKDDDGVPDPEVSQETADAVFLFMDELAPPARSADATSAEAMNGEALFTSVGCAKCHMPTLDSSEGPIHPYTDLLLHDILPADAVGIESDLATMREFRTAPLWGISKSAPYLHTGAADTIDEAIRAHDGEALTIRQAYEALSADDRADLLRFLDTL